MKTRILRRIKREVKYTFVDNRVTAFYFKKKKRQVYQGVGTFIFCALCEIYGSFYGLWLAEKYSSRNYGIFNGLNERKREIYVD